VEFQSRQKIRVLAPQVEPRLGERGAIVDHDAVGRRLHEFGQERDDRRRRLLQPRRRRDGLRLVLDPRAALGALLERARALPAHTTDAALLDAALATLLARHREAEIDANYATYAGHPLSEPDAWGDLESWLDAARNA